MEIEEDPCFSLPLLSPLLFLSPTVKLNYYKKSKCLETGYWLIEIKKWDTCPILIWCVKREC
jgi:hypothetical protein